MFESSQALEYTAVNEVWVITSIRMYKSKNEVWVITSIRMYKSKMKFESSQAFECTTV